MMKKLFFSLVLCFGIAGMMCEDVRGMEDVKSLVSDLAKDPTNHDTLENLVDALVDKENGSSRTDEAISVLSNIHVDEQYKTALDKIDCMIGLISSDWYEGYRKIHPVEYYVDGALNGEFGPYDLYSGKSL